MSWSFRLAVKRSQQYTGRSGFLHFAATSNPCRSLIDSQLAHDLWASCNPSILLELQPEDRCRHRSRAKA